ncbi:MAG TPA: C25 family cysteine peptidase, partial [Planctomycetota bacterium]|nr:C25 family cysteine peptidase [Planctomycetota bacterium]
MRLVVSLLLFASPAGSKYLERDLDKLRADYLVVAPPEFAEALDGLCDHRARTLKVAIARTDDIQSKYGKGPEGIAQLVASAKPRFLLLAGDTERIPTFHRKSSYQSDTFAGDAELATDHLFGAVTGRFPARTPAELGTMIEKTVEYETTLAGGRWQKRISFITGQGNFGPLIDPILEYEFTKVVTDQLPTAYDIETAYAKPSSKYCPHPEHFSDNAVRMLNEGALVYAYVGHGLRDQFDDFRWNGFSLPVLEAKDARRVSVKEGLPIMIVIACNTGEYDSPIGECIGTTLFKRRRGPVGFIGGSRITQPYGNALLGQRLVEQFLVQRGPTMGQALFAAKEAVLAEDRSAFRKQADAVAGLVQGPGSLEPMRKDAILLYNLLGDPALSIRRPADDLTIEPHGFPGPGRTFAFTGKARAGPVEISVECLRSKFCHPVDLVGDTLEQQLDRRYSNANNKVVVRTTAEVADGAFEGQITLPKDL